MAAAIMSSSSCLFFTCQLSVRSGRSELCGHLRFDPEIFKSSNCIPCRMLYITSQFMPRMRSDRPLPDPPESKNLAFISQFWTR
jgi:myosin-crossreactive antigen